MSSVLIHSSTFRPAAFAAFAARAAVTPLAS